MLSYRIIDFQTHSDQRGGLVAIENKKDIPFEIKRVYYLFGISNHARRGFHAHKRLTQVLICVNGSCTIHLDNGFDTAEVVLDNPTKGLLVENDMWREMYDFTKDAVLLVLASEPYSEDDYIRNYDDFIKRVKGDK